jgi:hypothetical protein
LRFRAQAAPIRLLHRWFAGDWHNVGLITGSRWRLLVLDVDGEEGLRSVPGLPNQPTPRVRTHLGYQAWFRHDGPPVPTRLKALPGVDLLADGWQVLAPPSRHPAGSVYAFADGLAFPDLDLAGVPAWVLELLHSPPPPDRLQAAARGESIAAGEGLARNFIYLAHPVQGGVNPEFPVWGIAQRGSWTSDEIQELYRKPEVALRCAAVLEQLAGRSLRLTHIGEPFCCILPDHTDRHPSASLWWDHERTGATGALVYRDWHQQPVAWGRESRRWAGWLTLPEVRASLAYGETCWLRDAEMWVWQMRLLVEAEVVLPTLVKARPLPPSVRPAYHRVYEGFQRLLGCKWLLKPGEPTAFAWQFAAAWCGVSMPHVGAAMGWLLQRGYLRQVGQYKRMALFQLG